MSGIYIQFTDASGNSLFVNSAYTTSTVDEITNESDAETQVGAALGALDYFANHGSEGVKSTFKENSRDIAGVQIGDSPVISMDLVRQTLQARKAYRESAGPGRIKPNPTGLRLGPFASFSRQSVDRAFIDSLHDAVPHIVPGDLFPIVLPK